MSPEEILKAAQNSPEEMGEYEKKVARKGVAYAVAIVIGICVVMILAEVFVFKKIDYGKPTLIFTMGGIANIFEGKGNGIKKMTVKGICEIILAVFCLILYIGAFFV